MSKEADSIPQPGANELNITVVFDNNPYKDGLETAWGFSCVVAGADKTILFDTGADGPMLLNNMNKLGIDPNTINVVVLSHIHRDHTGGMESFLAKNSHVTVCLPKSFPPAFKNMVTTNGAKMIQVARPLSICENVHSTGRLGVRIKEQALIMRTDTGLILITACAHPGIVKIVRHAKDLLKDDLFLVMGGFHLEWATKGKVKKIISAFERMGVRYVAPCHCTGEKARALFQEHFAPNYIGVGAGKTINLADLH